jgi:hypothetical protein
MRILVELLLAGALFAAMALLWRASGRVCFTPVPRTDGARIYTVVRASGDGGGLEQTVSSLLWLSGATGCAERLVITDDGLDGAGRRLAAILARDDPRVAVCPISSLPQRLEDSNWREIG